MKNWPYPPKAVFAALLLLSALSVPNALAVDGISSNALQQISALIAEKDSRTPAQVKLDSQLLYALKQSRGQPMAPGVPTLQFLPVADTNGLFNGLFKVDIDATVSSNLLTTITQSGGVIENSAPQFDAIRAGISLALAEQLAGRPDVRFIRVADEPHLNTGSVDSEGDVTQTADLARAAFGVNGGGVKVGVISDSVDHLAQSQATGDIPPDVTILPGQSGVPGTGEGTAMLEIVHDLAPGASLFFATAGGGPANFAQNILNLRAAGCDIIVDDVFYFNEAAFQDGVVARAVNTVTTNGGALYFSSAGNAGSKRHGTSTVWEGDFLDGGAAGSPVNGRNGILHDFGGGVAFNTVTVDGGGAFLFWADPLNASTNDYDLFILDSTGTTVLGASTTVQNGTVSGFEGLTGNLAAGLRIVIVKVSGDARFMHLDALFGQMQVNTTGWARGHAAATNAFSVAAVDVAHAFPNPFNGGAQDPVEDFSSDGPRRMFFQQDGTPITPNNFTNTGGAVRQYPTIASSDGVTTAVPGFAPFFGTSAAAPHAAAICALLKSLNPGLTQDEIRTVLTSTALDIETFGVDNTSGYGLIMALAALRAAPAGANLIVVTNFISGGNGNGLIDPNECNDFTVVLKNTGAKGATNIVGKLSTSTPGVIIGQRTSPYPDLPNAAIGTNVVPFSISTSPGFVCGTPVDLSLLVKSDQQTRVFTFHFQTGTKGVPVRYDNATPVAIPDNSPLGASSPITVSGFNNSLSKVSVGLFLTHTFDSDLYITLIAPDGTTNVLSANRGGGGNNFGTACSPDSNRTFFDDDATNSIGGGNAPFLGSFKPETPFAVYEGKVGTNVNGTWQLHAVDQAGQDVGIIQCWSLFLTPALCPAGGGQCPGVDLSIGMTPNPEPVFVGNNLLYTISVTNAGPDLAKNAVVSQVLPPGVIYVSGSASQGSVSQSGGVVTANLGNMAAGSIATILVTIKPTQVGLLSTTATVTSQNNDFDLSNNSVTVTSHVNPPFADLAVGLLDAPDPTIVGQTLTYTVSVTNRGPAPATFVTVTNVLPTTVAVLNATPSQGFVTISGNIVVCNFGSLSNAAVATAAINVSPILEGTIIATATASGAQIDPIIDNNSASTTTVVGPATDLAIGIVDVPDPVVIRSNLTYIISITNRGPSSASGVVVNDTLPAGVSVVSTNSSQGSITVSGSTVTCTLGNMTSGARATLTVVVNSTNSGTIFNTANVTGDQADPDASNNSASASTVVAPPFVSLVAERAVLTFESFGPTNGTVDPGETVTVNLYLRNAGNVVNTNLFATLLAVNGVTSPSSPQNYGILAPSATIARPFSFTASGAAGDSIIATLQLRDINLAQNITNNLGTVTFTFVLPNTVTFANTNRIDLPSTLQDQQQPGLASPYPSPITVSGITGLVGKVTVTLSNLNHTFPHDLNFLLVGPDGARALLMSHAADGSSATAVDVTFDDSAPSALAASGSITSGAWKPSAYDPSPTFTNPAPAGPYNSVLSVFNGPAVNGDWVLYANDDSAGDFGAVVGGWALTFTILNPVNQIADLLAAASASPNPVLAGNNLTNTFSITNAGPNDASLVWVTNILSPNAVLVSAENTLHAPFTTNGNTLLCNVGGLAAGASVKFTVVVSPTAAGLITNAASVTATSGEVDLNPANNSASAVVTANLPQADLGVSISASPNPVTVGSNLTATIIVTNSGPNPAVNVVVSNALPVGVNYVSGSASASQGTVSNLGGVIVANLGTLPNHGSASITFREAPFSAGSVTNTASVGGVATDGNSANNSASAVSTVLNPAPLILVPGVNLTSENVLPPNGALDAGETITADFTFTNAGAANTINLVATLLETNGVSSPSGPVSIGALVHGGAGVTGSFTFTAGSAPSGVVTATFQLQDGANDLGLATFAFTLPAIAGFTNNTAIIIPDHGSASPYPSTISVSGLAGLVGKVTVSLKGVTHGFPDDIDMILVSPTGQKVVLMSDTGGGHSITNLNLTFDDGASSGLPDSAQIVSGTYKPTDFETGDNFPPPAPAGAVSTFLSAFNGSNPNGNWSLYVVDDATGDAGAISGWSLAITTINPVSPAVNLVVTVTDSPDPVFVGAAVTYTITLTNRGPSTATGVFLSDILAPGMTLVSSNTTFGTFSLAPTIVTINVGTLSSGAGLVATLRVSPSLAGVIPNTVSATNSLAQVDLDPTSNFASITTTVLSPVAATLAIQQVAGQQLLITVTAEPGQIYTVQGSTNFSTWSPVFTATIPASGILKFTVPNSSTARFFRSVRVP